MKLLLDEQLSSMVAKQLRRRGHDVVTVLDVGLRGSPDDAVLEWATSAHRAVVTNNIRDFRPLHAASVTSMRSHHGIVLVSTAAYSLQRQRIGPLVAALDALLRGNLGDDVLRDREVFL